MNNHSILITDYNAVGSSISTVIHPLLIVEMLIYKGFGDVLELDFRMTRDKIKILSREFLT